MSTENAAKAQELTPEQKFHRLVTRANKGDKQALEELRRQLDDQPEIASKIGDLAAHAERVFVGLIAGKNRLLVESLPRRLRKMKAELLGPEPTLLEKMAIERIVATWLQLQWADCLVGSSEPGTVAGANLLLKWQRQADIAYRAAIRSLGDVRRLMLLDQQVTKLRVFGGDETSAGQRQPKRATGTD